MKMKKEFIKALDKITDELIQMDKDSFIKLMLKHSQGDYALILKEAGFLYKQDYNYYNAVLEEMGKKINQLIFMVENQQKQIERLIHGEPKLK